MTRFTEYQRHIERSSPRIPTARRAMIFDDNEPTYRRSINDTSYDKSYRHESDSSNSESDVLSNP